MRILDPLVLQRLLPSVTVVLTTFALMALLIRVLGVRNAGLRYALLHVPLIKGLLVLLRGSPVFAGRYEDKPFSLGLRIIDPLGTIPPISDFARLSVSAGVMAVVITAAILAAIIFLLFRWWSLYRLFRSLAQEEEARREDFPSLFAILDRLVPAFGVRYPRVVLISRAQLSPCSVGWRRPVILLLPDLLDELPEAELEAVLAHELAHIQRRDGLYHWLAVGLRDVLFFNPFAHLVFDRLLLEKEKACDHRAIGQAADAQRLARALLDVSLLAQREGWAAVPGGLTMSQSLVRRTMAVRERIAYMLRGSADVRVRWWQWATAGAFTLLILGLQLNLQVRVMGHILTFE